MRYLLPQEFPADPQQAVALLAARPTIADVADRIDRSSRPRGVGEERELEVFSKTLCGHSPQQNVYSGKRCASPIIAAGLWRIGEACEILYGFSSQ
jgi:hypothetical protein